MRTRIGVRSGAGADCLRAHAAATVAVVLALGVPAPARAAPGVMAWGGNANGELGNETSTKSTSAVAVSGLGAGVKQLAAGSTFALALLGNGTAEAWGANEYGQLATGSSKGPETCTSSEPCSTKPQAVTGLSGVRALAAGGAHSLALLSDGTVKTWGLNESGELGSDPSKGPETCGRSPFTEPCSTKPVTVNGLSEVIAVSAARASLALLSDGKVMAWGNNEYGQLGIGTTSSTFTPTEVSGLSNVVAISAGDDHSLALLSDGSVMAWGLNNDGQLGNGTTTDSSTPVQVSGLKEVVAISAGGFHSLALLANGTVLAWGSDGNGQLGSGTSLETCGGAKCAKTPTAVNGVSGVSAISAGLAHSLALLGEGTVKSWGWDNEGQLGDGAIGESEPVPGPVAGVSGAALIGAGAYYGLSYSPPRPAVEGLSPNFGGKGGGTSVTIRGTNFAFVSAVKFGSTNAESYAVNSEASITAVAPPGTGTTEVTVTNPGGNSETSSADRFTYIQVPAPTVRKVSPRRGSSAGGTSVTITGTNLAQATAVYFGAARAASFIVNAPSSVTAIAPARSPGVVDVRVVTPGGTSTASTHDHFRFVRHS
jgi:alpha-tubulin suppressor-like RCC1 family protein